MIKENAIDTKGVVIAELGEGNIVGEFGLIENSAASATVTAATVVEIIKIDNVSFLKFLDSDPKIGYEVMKDLLQVLLNRMHNLNQTTLHLVRRNVEYNLNNKSQSP